MAPRFDPPPSARLEREVDRWADVPDITTAPYGTSLFRRRIRLVNLTPERTAGELEDDCHHFRVDLHHDGSVIERVDGRYFRGPWSTCATAPSPLRAIEGRPLTERGSDVGRYTDPRANCTHLFDLTALAVTHAARRAARERQYDMVVTDTKDSEQHAMLWRDGAPVLHWVLRDREIAEPGEWAGAPLRSKFIPWVEARHDADMAEAAIALRRIVDISMSRTGDLDRFNHATEMANTGLMGRCLTYTAENIPIAVRVKGSARNWEQHGHLMLADMHLRD